MNDRAPDYQFVVTDPDTIISDLRVDYERLTGRAMNPSDPEMLILRWVADAIVQLNTLINYVGNQNIPSRADDENLDALGELFFLHERPQAQPSQCTMKFMISAAQENAILIPAGTRVTNETRNLVWETQEDAYINPGETEIQLPVICQTTGTNSNGYMPGELNTIVDVFDYYTGCENVTETDGGTDIATDDEFYELLRASEDAWSTAGPSGSYIYHAKAVSTEIGDVCVRTPSPGEVRIYLMKTDGTEVSEQLKQAVLAACNAEEVRPLTDHVLIDDPEEVTYDIDVKYFIPTDATESSKDIEDAVNEAIDEYVVWQSEKFGRDINPSKLIWRLMQTGVKRVEVTAPVFTELSDDSIEEAPKIAKLGHKSVVNGGSEDE